MCMYDSMQELYMFMNLGVSVHAWIYWLQVSYLRDFAFVLYELVIVDPGQIGWSLAVLNIVPV